MNKIALVYTTLPNEQEAEKLAEQVVAKELATCVNLFAIRSVYRWQGKLEKDKEWAVLLKASLDKVSSLVQWIEANHPYEVPAIWWQEMISSPQYAAFVNGG